MERRFWQSSCSIEDVLLGRLSLLRGSHWLCFGRRLILPFCCALLAFGVRDLKIGSRRLKELLDDAEMDKRKLKTNGLCHFLQLEGLNRRYNWGAQYHAEFR